MNQVKQRKLQLECVEWFNNRYPQLKGLLFRSSHPTFRPIGPDYGHNSGLPELALTYKERIQFFNMLTSESLINKDQTTNNAILKDQGITVYPIRTLKQFKSTVDAIIAYYQVDIPTL